MSDVLNFCKLKEKKRKLIYYYSFEKKKMKFTVYFVKSILY